MVANAAFKIRVIPYGHALFDHTIPNFYRIGTGRKAADKARSQSRRILLQGHMVDHNGSWAAGAVISVRTVVYNVVMHQSVAGDLLSEYV